MLPNLLPAQISVYFNRSIDSTLALPGNVASGDQDFAEITLGYLGEAEHSVDMAMYNLSVESIVEGLIAAKERGVKVRVIGHVENIKNARFERLRSEGILVHSNPEAPDGERQGLMHNKFFVIDGRPGISPNNIPTVITGSWNATVNQTWVDPNNIVVIEDREVAEAYLTEFEEMWGSSGDLPNIAAARFGNTKLNNTPHEFTLSNGVRVALWFSPSDQTSSRIVAVLETGQTSIYTANLTFTYNELSTALRNQAEQFNADIRCIIDNVDDLGSDYNFLRGFAETFDWQDTAIFHHKYGIVDAVPIGSGSAPAVITGSHNWTSSAENFNDENTLIIYNEEIANQFLQEFAVRYREVGGNRVFMNSLSVNEIEDALRLHIWPNPASGFVVVAGEAGGRLSIADLFGRIFRVYEVEAGALRLDLSELPEGVYFMSIGAVKEMIRIVR